MDNMTESEAIEKLMAYHKCQRLQVKGIYEDCNEKLCDNCDLCYAQGNTGEHIKSIEIAIQALEKQIPKKVQLRHIRKFDGFDDGECTTCGNIVSRDCDGTDNFCPDCGQKLDWRGEE